MRHGALEAPLVQRLAQEGGDVPEDGLLVGAEALEVDDEQVGRVGFLEPVQVEVLPGVDLDADEGVPT